MIKLINFTQLGDCLGILIKGYEDIALTFGMTENNSPYRGRTRLPLGELEKGYGKGYLMYGYFNEDILVGFLSLIHNNSEINIHDLAILPEFQNNGFGSKLIKFAVDKAKSLNCAKVTLGMVDDNTKLKKWYERKGFKTVNLKKFESVDYTVGTMELML